MTVYITTPSMLMEAFCSCCSQASHRHKHTHTHREKERAQSLKASLSVFQGDYVCTTLHAPLATLIQCWTFSFYTFFDLFYQLFSPQSLFPLLQHFHTVSSSLGLFYSMHLLHVAGLFSLSICVTEVASRSFRAALQSYSMGPRLRGNPTVKSLSVF